MFNYSNINHIFRYGYTGVIFFLVLYFCKFPSELTKEIIKHPSILFALIFTVGAMLHIIYKTITEQIMLDFIYFVRRKLNLEESPFIYLVSEFKVKRKNVLDAFRLTRNDFFSNATKNIFYLQHSENHLLYVTSFIFILFVIIILFCKMICFLNCSYIYNMPYFITNLSSTQLLPLLLFILAFFIFGILGVKKDLDVEKTEYFHMKMISNAVKEEIKKKLAGADLIEETVSKAK